MIVIDVGCAKHGGDESIPYLVQEFHPRLLMGFDPSAAGEEQYYVEETQVHIYAQAAWTYTGKIGFEKDGLRGRISPKGREVSCFNLSELILTASDNEIVLKMDAEGSEYVLLEHLRETGADKRLKLAWVEWHCMKCGTGWFTDDDRCGRCKHHEPGKRSTLEKSMGCEMHQWNL